MPVARDIITHLLRRTEYVARPARVTELTAKANLAAAVDDILNVSLNPADTPPPIIVDGDTDWESWVTAVNWWVDRMVNVPRPIQEKMTMFWHGHLVSSWDKAFSDRAMVGQNRTLRALGLGDFRTLMHAIAIDPAMLMYLDNADNNKWSPNQNFARELLELFTLGIGNYTEGDVEAASVAWTGHNLDWETGTYEFRPNWHEDELETTFMGVTKVWDGPEIIDHVLVTNTTARTTSARLICKKLWEFFAHPSPPAAALDAMVTAYLADNRSIRTAVRTMLLRDEFYSTTARNGLVRTPTDVIVSIAAVTGISLDILHPEWFGSECGQELFNPPNVAGWKHNSYWINTAAWSGRASLARYTTWKLLDIDAHSDLGDNTPADVVRALEERFSCTWSTTTRAALENFITRERQVNGGPSWSEWANGLTLVLMTPEFHLA
jgi:uncharacterized protein (DUF1800 family)